MFKSSIRNIASAALIAGAALSVATPAAATNYTYNVTSVGAYHLDQFNISGNIANYGYFNSNEYGGPIVIQGTTPQGKPFSVVTFCFDILHGISGGFGYQAGLNYTFTAAPLVTDQVFGAGAGNPLTLAQSTRMSGLARFGALSFVNGATDLNNKMPAIQAALWSVEYGLTAVMANPTQQAYYNQYLTMPLTFSSHLTPGLVGKDGSGTIVGYQQGLALGHGLGAVPEPSEWAMLIAGFAMVGAVLRRRHTAKTVAA